MAVMPRTITGFNAGVNGDQVRIVNINGGAVSITLSHQDVASVAANRIIGPGLGNVTLRAGGFVDLWYDGSTSRWRVMGP
jgi:hypothetical protein